MNASRARRRRAMAAVVCVFLGGASAGAAVGLNYTSNPRKQYEKAFDSIGLSTTQRHATDSIMAHYACVLDSVYRVMAPHVDSVRRAARQDVFEVLSDSQAAQLNRALTASDPHHSQRHSDKRTSCEHPADSSASHGRPHLLRI